MAEVLREPDVGATVEVAPGIRWLRLPMPGVLGYVNAFVLDDGDGWAILDTGPDFAATHAAWETLLAGPLAGKPVRRILATHGHSDHIGLAGPLSERFGVPVHASRGEWNAAVLRYGADRLFEPGYLTAYYAGLGCDEAMIGSVVQSRTAAASHIAPVPPSYRRLREDDLLSIGGREWRVSTGGGHSPEHVVLHSAADGILIAGDHLLPRITPFVGTDPFEPLGNPLRDFFATLDGFARLPEGTLVLPGHGRPFRDPAARAAEIRRHHDQRLAELEAVPSAGTALDFAQRLFPRAIAGGHARFALSETAAHLNLLVDAGRMRRSDGPRFRYALA